MGPWIYLTPEQRRRLMRLSRTVLILVATIVIGADALGIAVVVICTMVIIAILAWIPPAIGLLRNRRWEQFELALIATVEISALVGIIISGLVRSLF